MTLPLYFLIGAIYADAVLVNNMFNMPNYENYRFVEKLGYYIGDLVIWPVSLIGSIVLYFAT